jgi:hypothetical protein
MRIFVLAATYELRVSRKNHLRDHPSVDRRDKGKRKWGEKQVGISAIVG